MRLIDADALLKKEHTIHIKEVGYTHRCIDREDIILAPTIEAKPIRHGHWDDKSIAFYRKCSECGCCIEWDKNPFYLERGEYNYCPSCGAKMDERRNDVEIR